MSEPEVNRSWPRRLVTAVRDGWVIAGICLLMVFVVDAVLREFAGNGGGGPDRRAASFYATAPWADAYWREHKQAKEMRWNSYVYWRRRPYSGSQINVDEDGVRRSVLQRATDASTPEVWVFGGSSVWGTGVPDELTLPSLLAAELDEIGLRYRVRNFGESGYVSTQSLITLGLELRDRPAPAIAVFVEGANDVYAAFQTGKAGLPQNEFRRQAEFRSSDGLDNYLSTFPYILEGVMTLFAQAPQWEIKTLASDVVQVMVSNRQQALAMSEAYGFSVMNFWQPTAFELSVPTPFEQDIITASDPRHAALQRAAMVAMGEEECFLDLGSEIAGVANDRFMDFVHPGPQANAAMASAIAERLAASPDCLEISDSLADRPRD